MSALRSEIGPAVDGLVLQIRARSPGPTYTATLHWPASWESESRSRSTPIEVTQQRVPDLPTHAVDLALVSLADTQPDEALLKDLHRVLRPGGELVLAEMASATASEPVASLLGRLKFENAIAHPDRTMRATKPTTLKAEPAPPPITPPDRLAGYAWLSGEGLEIGAFTEPAQVPSRCRVRYFDAIDAATARKRFPELDPTSFVEVDHVGDLDRGDLARFAPGQFDFVICNHVIEHVANPVGAVRDLFRLVRSGGHVVIAVPDKRFTFDHERALTSFEHLWADHEAGVSENSDEHYLDFIRHAVPHVLAESPENLALHVARCRERKEHAHVWDSRSFRAFLDDALRRLNLGATCIYEVTGDRTRIEYFSVWQK